MNQPARKQIIPWELQPMNAEECAEQVFRCKPRTFLSNIACKPGFPVPIQKKPLAWRAGDVIEFRDSNPVSQTIHQRKSGNKLKANLCHGAQSSAQVP